MNDCIFCNQADLRVVDENQLALALRDNYPVTEGHTLIIGFYPVFSDGFEKTANCQSLLATRRRIRGLWNISM